MDFGDLLLHNLTLFHLVSDIHKEISQRFKYILVDEYQDRTSRSISGSNCWPGGIRTSAASATTINPSMAGAAPRSVIFKV